MLCSRVQNLLSAYLDSELTGEEMLQVRSHLNRCPDCQREHAALRQVKQLLGAMHGVEPHRPFGPEMYQPAPQPGRFRLLGRVYRVDRWLSRLGASCRAFAFSLNTPLSPVALGGVLGVGILAVALVRQPQLPDAVSARVPESVPVEVAAAYPEPALELVTAPVPDTPVMNVMGRPYPAPASHFHVYQPAGYVIFQPGLARGRYLLLNGGYSGYPAPVSSAGLETVGYAPDGRYSRP